jgi:hypothetical protein
VCKDGAFESEKEWRLGTVIPSGRGELPKESIKHRPGRSFLIPYVTVGINDPWNPIVSVMTGPSAHPKLSVNSVQTLLRAHRLDDVQVNSSQVPFRDW